MNVRAITITTRTILAGLLLVIALGAIASPAHSDGCPDYYDGLPTVLDTHAAYTYACTYDSSNNPSYFAYSDDSANFVSQLLLTAGESETTGYFWNESQAWGTDGPTPGSAAPPLHADSWATPQDLHQYLIESGIAYEVPQGQNTPGKTRAGDVIFWDWNSAAGTYNDVSMVVSGTGGRPGRELVASHIPDSGTGPTDSSVTPIPGLTDMSSLMSTNVGAYVHSLAAAEATKYGTSGSCPASDSGSGTAHGTCWSWHVLRPVATAEAPGPHDLGETFGGWNPSEADCQACEGDPVDSATGELDESVTDIAIPGRGPAISLDRSYASQMASIEGRFGYGWTDPYGMSVTADDDLADTEDVNQENGSIVRFTHQANGTWAAPDRVFATLVHNGDGTWTFTRRSTDTFRFSSTGALTAESDLNGGTTTLSYASGRLATITDPGGRTLTFAYTGGVVSQVEDSAGRTVSYGYDSNDNLTGVTDLNGHVAHYGYDGSHQMTSMTSPKGGVTTNVFNGSGRVTSQTDPNGYVTTWVYSIDSTLTGTTTITDPESIVTQDTYSGGDLTSQTVGAGTSAAATTTYEYDPETNNQTKVTDPNGHVTTDDFDLDGNKVRETDPLGQATTWTYNDFDQVTSVTPPKTYGGTAATTTYSYDQPAYSSGGHGNLTTVSTPILASNGTSLGTQITHAVHGDAAHPGDITSKIDALGSTWTYTYDSQGYKTSETAPATSDNADQSGSHQIVKRWAYNVQTGWTTAELGGRYTLAHPSATTCTTPAAACTTYTHDDAGHVLVTTDGAGHHTTNTYDADGNLASATDPDGNETTYAYDDADQQIHETRPDSSILTTRYWPDGQVKDQLDAANNATHYTYDALGDTATVIDPDSHVRTYRYDGVGNLLAKGNPGVSGCSSSSTADGCTTFTYDADDHRVAVHYHDAGTTDLTATYDANGQRASMTDGTGTSTTTYDSLGRVTSVTDGAGHTVSYGHDDAADVTSIDYPDSVGTVDRTYDAEGRMDSVTDWVGNTSRFEYDHDGNLAKTSVPATTGLVDSGQPFGTYGTGNGQLNGATGDAIDASGNVWIADSGNNRLEEFSAAGAFVKTVGTYGSDDGELDFPLGVAIDRTAGDVYVADYSNNRIEEFTVAGAFVRTFGSGGSDNGELSGPSALAVDASGNVWVADTWNNRIQEFASDGTFIQAFGTWGNGDGQLEGPKGIAVDGTSVYVADTANNRVERFTTSGNYVAQFGSSGSIDGHLNDPEGVATDPHDGGTVFVTDTGNNRLEAFTPAGTFVATYGASGNGTGNVSSPKGIAFTAAGAAYVNDHGNSRITAWALPAGVVDTTTYDTADAVSGTSVDRGSTNLASLDYDRDAASQLTQGTSSGVPSDDHAYSYNELNQLEGVDSDSFDFDSADHVTQFPDGLIQAYDPAGELTSATKSGATTAFSYDANGDRTAGPVDAHASNSFGYDAAGNLRTATTATSAAYTYDGDGLRASKTVGATTVGFTWDVTSPVGALLLTDGTTSYLYGPGGAPLEQQDGSQALLWYHHDQIGSTRLLTDTSATVVGTATYDAYGARTASTGVISRLGFEGQYQDAETGFLYLRARYYDPNSAQFLTLDPDVGTTLDGYGYASENPLNMVDPLGTCSLLNRALGVVKKVANVSLQTAQTLPYGVYAASYYVLRSADRANVPLPAQEHAGLIILEGMGYGADEGINILRGKGIAADDARVDTIIPNSLQSIWDPSWLYTYLPGLGRDNNGALKFDWSW